VFADYDDMAARIDDPDLQVDENSVLVLKSAGPQGAPGMPEWGQLPIPKKLLVKEVRDRERRAVLEHGSALTTVDLPLRRRLGPARSGGGAAAIYLPVTRARGKPDPYDRSPAVQHRDAQRPPTRRTRRTATRVSAGRMTGARLRAPTRAIPAGEGCDG
jgi:Dehydratase family